MPDPNVNLGIDVATIIAGSAGGLCRALMTPQKNATTIITLMVVGGATANYVTPLAMKYAGIEFAGFIAFALGVGGMIVCELIVAKIKAYANKGEPNG